MDRITVYHSDRLKVKDLILPVNSIGYQADDGALFGKHDPLTTLCHGVRSVAKLRDNVHRHPVSLSRDAVYSLILKLRANQVRVIYFEKEPGLVIEKSDRAISIPRRLLEQLSAYLL
jgi:hypothetical protein